MQTHTAPAVAPDTWELAAALKAAGDPLRLAILRVLRQDSYGVLELCQILDVKQSGMSHHLKVLASAGLVTARREGNTLFYRRQPVPVHPGMTSLVSALFEAADALPLDWRTQKRIARIQKERAQSSRQFFRNNAGHFREQQEQIAEQSLYAAAVIELLDSLAIAQNIAIEVGPGNGEFLGELTRRFKQVIAVDNSPAMLAAARRHAMAHRLGDIRFLCADVADAKVQRLRADCVVANMVLHHTASPATLLAQLQELLAPGGVLLLSELCPHQQAWVREACGDVWLGFEPEDLSRWATSAGLTEGRSQYLALRNGFQIQIRCFAKPDFSRTHGFPPTVSVLSH